MVLSDGRTQFSPSSPIFAYDTAPFVKDLSLTPHICGDVMVRLQAGDLTETDFPLEASWTLYDQQSDQIIAYHNFQIDQSGIHDQLVDIADADPSHYSIHIQLSDGAHTIYESTQIDMSARRILATRRSGLCNGKLSSSGAPHTPFAFFSREIQVRSRDELTYLLVS